MTGRILAGVERRAPDEGVSGAERPVKTLRPATGDGLEAGKTRECEVDASRCFSAGRLRSTRLHWMERGELPGGCNSPRDGPMREGRYGRSGTGQRR